MRLLKTILQPFDERDHPRWFNLSPGIEKRLKNVDITISVYSDGCNQTAEVTRITVNNPVTYFYRFDCREFYIDNGDLQTDPGIIDDFDSLDDLITSVIPGFWVGALD